MSIALDYTTRIDPAALRAAGVTDVFRYLSWMNYWNGQVHSYPNPKIILQAEYDELTAAGIAVTLNWEYDAHDWMSGATGGAVHAVEAVRQAQARGYPAGATIVGSADFDMTRTQWELSGRPYGAAYRDGIRAGGYRPGVYGPYDVLTWCRDELGYDAFWQCMSTSFSAGRNGGDWPGAQVRQIGYKTVGGVTGDWNRILAPDWGQARSGRISNMASGILIAGEAIEDYLPRIERALWWPIPGMVASVAELKATVADLAALKQPATVLTAEQVAAIGQAVAAALPAALEAALGSVSLKVETAA